MTELDAASLKMRKHKGDLRGYDSQSGQGHYIFHCMGKHSMTFFLPRKIKRNLKKVVQDDMTSSNYF